MSRLSHRLGARGHRSFALLAAALATAAVLASAQGATADGGLITGGPTGPVGDATPTFTWEATGAATCAIDGLAPQPCTTPFTTAELLDGPHVFELTIGEQVEARSIVVDTIAPSITMDGEDGVRTDPTSTFTFVAEPGTDTSCAIDGNGFEACTSPFTTPALRNGTHVVRVRATDAAGNHGETQRVVRMEVVGPDTIIAAGPEGVTSELRPQFSFTASRAGATYECAIDGVAFKACASSFQPADDLAPGPHTLQVRAVDAAGNADVSPAERAFTVAICQPSVTLGAVNITAGCLHDSGGGKIEASGPVKVNGVTFAPRSKDGSAATISIDVATRTIVAHDIQLRMGSIVLYRGDLEFVVPAEETFTLAEIDLETKTKTDAPAKDSEAALDLTGDDDAQAAGLPLTGTAKLELSKGAAVLTATIGLPEVFTDAEGKGLTGTVKVTSDNEHGVQLKLARVTAPLAFVGKVELQNLSVAFVGDGEPGPSNPTCNTPSPGLRWEGSASVIVMPAPGRPQLTDVGLGLADGAFSHAEATLKPSGDGAELGAGVKVTKLTVSLCAGPPVVLKGRAGLTALPGKDGKPRLVIPDAGLIYTGATDKTPWTIRAEAAEASIAGDIPIVFRDLFLQVSGNGAVDFGGGVKFTVPLKGSAGPVELDASVTVDASATGFVEGSRYNVELRATGCFNGSFKVSPAPSISFSDVCPGIEGLISSTGFAVCGSLKVGSKDIGRIGAGKKWDGDVEFMKSSCDVGPWRVPREIPKPDEPTGAAARAGSAQRFAAGGTAPGERRFAIARGQRGVLVAVRGRGAPPQVMLRGPGGASITTPAEPDGSSRTDRALAFSNVATQTTYIALRSPRGGTWTATPVAGSKPVAQITAAPLLAPVKVRGRVEGAGRSRTLRFHASSRAGQRITLVERGQGVAHTIGTAAGRAGAIPFRPATGPAGRRTIEALVEQDGMPRERITVASYAAPGPPKPARPSRVRVSRKGSTLRVGWSRAARASRYAIRVEVADGRALFFVRPAGQRQLTVPGVEGRLSATVRVVGLRPDNTAGPAGIAHARVVRRSHR